MSKCLWGQSNSKVLVICNRLYWLPMVKVVQEDFSFLKSMDISWVLEVLQKRFAFSRQLRRLTRAVSSAYFIKCLLKKVLLHKLMYEINNKDEKTHHSNIKSKNLGIIFSQYMTFDQHVIELVHSCCLQLWNIAKISHLLQMLHWKFTL